MENSYSFRWMLKIMLLVGAIFFGGVSKTFAYDLVYSSRIDRADAQLLDAATVKGNIAVFVDININIKSVRFFIDNQLHSTEGLAPWDLAGTAANGGAKFYSSLQLSDGIHSFSAQVTLHDGQVINRTALVTVENLTPVVSGYALQVSDQATRANAIALDTAVLKGSAYIYVQPEQNLSRVDFYIDRPPQGAADKVEGALPFDFAGTATNGLALPFNTSTRADGNHFIYAVLTKTDSSIETIVSNFQIANQTAAPAFTFTPSQVAVSVDLDAAPVDVPVLLGLNADADGLSPDFTLVSNVPWATVIPLAGVAPETLTVRLNPHGLGAGQYQGVLTLTSTEFGPMTLPLTLLVGSPEEDKCAPVVCASIRVDLPCLLEFTAEAGHLKDRENVGTGFTYVMPATYTSPYLPMNLDANLTDGLLRITTTNGILHLNNNNQTNAVGIGFAGPNQTAKISALLVNPPTGTGNYEQAGIWFGTDENNYIKLVYSSFPSNQMVEMLYERNGQQVKSQNKAVGSLINGNVLLELIANPTTGMVSAFYTVNNGARSHLATYAVESEMFSFDAAGIDPVIGTRSFAGLMATHRNATSPLTYAFDYFHLEAVESGSVDSPIQFSRLSHPISFPTSMAWAPDGKLYVTELFGAIHALTYDENLNVIEDQVITGLVDALGARLTLGITVRQDDPFDIHQYSLWISSSSPSVNAGTANSSTITRLSGPDFSIVEQIITGLPRAIANHAINSLHFGPDNRLYLAAGGNTGAGAPVAVATEFGNRAEQPLSAAILVADVFADDFDGSCANNLDIYGPAPCSVTAYATGLRNSYDFVFHSNGSLYATDNGLGVTGAYPPSPTPGCSGLSNPAPVSEGGNNPGAQVDLLLRILPGKYYGHPNPSRLECVFQNGSYQGVAPLPNYQAPLLELSKNASANGIVEYKSTGVCSPLEHNLLFVRYSLGDDIVRVQLAPDGLAVVAQSVLVGGFNDPLYLTEHKGNLFVAEMGGGKITALKPNQITCL